MIAVPKRPVNKHRVYWVVALVFLAITLTSLTVLRSTKRSEDVAAQAASAAANSSGSDFLVNQQPVQVQVDGLLQEFNTDGDLGVTLRLNKFTADSTAGLANEALGKLVPTLRISNCNVDPAQAYAVSTDQPVEAFTWHWSAVCPNAGEHDLSILIAFQLDDGADPGTSDPIAYRGSTTIYSHDPFVKRITAVIGIVGTIVTLLSSGWALYGQMKPKKNQTTPA